MNEAYGDLWSVPADARVILTNGDVNARGLAIMGKGSALEAAQRYPSVPRRLGTLLSQSGNHVHFLGLRRADPPEWLFSFPTKHSWRDRRADLALIERSAHELVARVEELQRRLLAYPVASRLASDRLRVVLGRPGCGAGGLDYNDVKGVLWDILDDRFTVVTFPPKSSPRSSATSASLSAPNRSSR